MIFSSSPPVKRWALFCLLVVLLFLAKSLFYLSILPPLEGWDEYQHLAYIYHLDEHGERPVMYKATVSRKLLAQIISIPAPEYMAEQAHSAGAVSYKNYFSNITPKPAYNPDHSGIMLYQAQHGDLYYRAILPLFRMLSTRFDIVTTIFLLRLVNLTFLLVSLLTLLWFISKIVPNRWHAAMLILLIFSKPILFTNGARIANDALSIMLGTWVIVIGLMPRYRDRTAMVVVAGILAGLAGWAKSTGLLLLPYMVLYLGISAYRKKVSCRKALLNICLGLGCAAAVMAPHLYFNLEHYQMLFTMNEALMNAQNRISLVEVLSGVRRYPMINDILGVWFKEGVWAAGWSFLRVRDLSGIYRVLTGFGVLGWLWYFWAKRFQLTSHGLLTKDTALLCFAIPFFSSLTVAWHYLHYAAAYGFTTYCPWYASLAMPIFLLFFYDSACRWSPLAGYVSAFLLYLVHIYADLRGSLLMISCYSGGIDPGAEALSRIAALHPPLLDTLSLFIGAYLFTGVALILTFTVIPFQRSLTGFRNALAIDPPENVALTDR